MHNAKHVATRINLSRSLRFILCISIFFSFESIQTHDPVTHGKHMLSLDVLQLAFLNDSVLFSMSYGEKGTIESTIVDFRRMDIQNLEEIRLLPWLRRET